jgi:hypothetical protein
MAIYGELLIRDTTPGDPMFCYDEEKRDPVILFLHLMATLSRFLGPHGIRSKVTELIPVKQQLPIPYRSRQSSPVGSGNISFRHRQPNRANPVVVQVSKPIERISDLGCPI